MPVFRLFKQAPITIGLTWIACILFMGVALGTPAGDGAHSETLVQWGAGVVMNIYTSESPQEPMRQVPGFRGATHVWDGEWWRLLVNNLHHGELFSDLPDRGLMHLMCNATALLICGRIIEQRMSHLLYLIFIVSSATVVAASTGLAGEFGVGLSGVLYAFVGLLFVWRDHDESVADEFPLSVVLFSGAWLLLCQVLTYTDVLHIANVAHYAGFIYGWIWGQVYLEQQQKGLFRFLFGVGHLLLIPAFWFIMHPFWIGSWHWYLAHGEKVNNRYRMERLQTALLLTPSLTNAWYDLSLYYEGTGDRRLALRVSMEGLKHNRTSEPLLNRTIDLWVDDVQQTGDSIGELMITQVFDQEADRWDKKITQQAHHSINRLAWEPDDLIDLMGQRIKPPDQSNGFSLLMQRPEQLPLEREFDPSAPDSAREGTLF